LPTKSVLSWRDAMPSTLAMSSAPPWRERHRLPFKMV
jgi:hypothetical protein